MKHFFSKLILLVAALGAISLAARGQVPTSAPAKLDNIPLAPGPILNRAAEFAKWTITCTYSETTKPGPVSDKQEEHRLQTVTVTKTQAIYHEQKFYSDGSSDESWHVGNLQIAASPLLHGKLAIYTPESFGSSGSDPLLYTDYGASDFPNLAWLSVRNYLGVQKNKDAQHLVFQDKIQAPFPGLNSSTPETTARIDLQTHLPAQIQNDTVTLNYSFDPPPTAPLVLPPDVQRLLHERAHIYRTLTKPIPSY